MSERVVTRLVFSLAASSMVLLLAACGGGGSSTAAAAPAGANDTTAGGATPSVPAEMQAYVACLKDHGVTLPNGGRFRQGDNAGQGGQGQGGQAPPGSFQLGAPQTQVQTQTGGGNAGSPPPSFDRSRFEAARQACADKLPEGVSGFGPGAGFVGGGNGGPNASAFNAYRSCMADHGVTLPQRQAGQNGQTGSSQAPVSIDRNSATFKAANDVCSALLPTPNQGQGQQQTQGSNP